MGNGTPPCGVRSASTGASPSSQSGPAPSPRTFSSAFPTNPSGNSSSSSPPPSLEALSPPPPHPTTLSGSSSQRGSPPAPLQPPIVDEQVQCQDRLRSPGDASEGINVLGEKWKAEGPREGSISAADEGLPEGDKGPTGPHTSRHGSREPGDSKQGRETSDSRASEVVAPSTTTTTTTTPTTTTQSPGVHSRTDVEEVGKGLTRVGPASGTVDGQRSTALSGSVVELTQLSRKSSNVTDTLKERGQATKRAGATGTPAGEKDPALGAKALSRPQRHHLGASTVPLSSTSPKELLKQTPSPVLQFKVQQTQQHSLAQSPPVNRLAIDSTSQGVEQLKSDGKDLAVSSSASNKGRQPSPTQQSLQKKKKLDDAKPPVQCSPSSGERQAGGAELQETDVSTAAELSASADDVYGKEATHSCPWDQGEHPAEPASGLSSQANQGPNVHQEEEEESQEAEDQEHDGDDEGLANPLDCIGPGSSQQTHSALSQLQQKQEHQSLNFQQGQGTSGGGPAAPECLLEWTLEEEQLLEKGLTLYPADKFSPLQRYLKIAASLPSKTARDVALRCRWLQSKGAYKRRRPEDSAVAKKKKDKAGDSSGPGVPSVGVGNSPSVSGSGGSQTGTGQGVGASAPAAASSGIGSAQGPALLPWSQPSGLPGPYAPGASSGLGPAGLMGAGPFGSALLHGMNPRVTDGMEKMPGLLGAGSLAARDPGKLLEVNRKYIAMVKANVAACKAPQENNDLLGKLRDNIMSILHGMTHMPGVMSQMPPLPVKLNLELAAYVLKPHALQ